MWVRADATAVRQPRKIRYSEAEWMLIVERAQLCGRAPARYVRETSLGAVPRPTRAQPSAPLIHELGRIGTALAALSKQSVVSDDAARADAIDRTLDELLAVVRQLA